MNEELIKNVTSAVEKLFEGNSGGHDFEHTMRVYRNATRIAEIETGCDERVVMLAALLHDADDHKLFDTEGNANARAILAGNGVPEEDIDRICDVINSVSFSKNKDKVPDSLEGKIVQDADRLDAMGAIGVARTFAYGGEHGRSIEESVNHFHEKLLLLYERLNTDAARELGRKRHEFLESFLAELGDEIG